MTANQIGRLKPAIFAKFIGLAIMTICSLEQVKLTFEKVNDCLDPGHIFKELDRILAGNGDSSLSVSYEDHKSSVKECLKITINRNTDIDADEGFQRFLSGLKEMRGGWLTYYQD